MNVLIFILACWGLTHILVVGTIFDSPRDWITIKSEFLGKMLACHQCCSFWVGMAMYFAINGLPDLFLGGFDFFFWGLISSGAICLLKALNYFLFSFKQ
jgi:hypothetical protein